MSIRWFAAAAVMCLLSHAARAQDAPAPDPAQPVKEKKICRSVVPTGTIMSKRMCLTKAEWAKLNQQYEKQNETFRDRQSRGGQTGAQ